MWQFGVIGNDVGQITRSCSTSNPVSTGMGDRIEVRTRGAGNLSRSNQPPRSTQPDHPSVGRRTEYRPRAVILCGRGRQVWIVFGGR